MALQDPFVNLVSDPKQSRSARGRAAQECTVPTIQDTCISTGEAGVM